MFESGDGDFAPPCPQQPVRMARAQQHGTLKELALRAGVSERHLRRLLKREATDGSAAANRVLTQLNAPPATAKLLEAYGCPDLIGSDAHRWLEGHLKRLAPQLRALVDADGSGIDPRWAEGTATMLFRQLETAAGRRRQRIEECLIGANGV